MTVASKKCRLSMMISFEGTVKNQWEPGQDSIGDATVLLHFSLLRNP